MDIIKIRSNLHVVAAVARNAVWSQFIEAETTKKQNQNDPEYLTVDNLCVFAVCTLAPGRVQGPTSNVQECAVLTRDH